MRLGCSSLSLKQSRQGGVLLHIAGQTRANEKCPLWCNGVSVPDPNANTQTKHSTIEKLVDLRNDWQEIGLDILILQLLQCLCDMKRAVFRIVGEEGREVGVACLEL